MENKYIDRKTEGQEDTGKKPNQKIFNRRQFLKIGGTASTLGLASYVLPESLHAGSARGTNVNGLRLGTYPNAGGREEAQAMFNASNEAQMIAADWVTKYNLTFEPDRFLLFSVPSGVTQIGLPDAINALQVVVGMNPADTASMRVENVTSLLGESAYSAFLNDHHTYAKFRRDQMEILGTASRIDLSKNIGKAIGNLTGPVLAAACCCCCSCCSICCCSSNDGDQKIAAAPAGDSRVMPSDPTLTEYYRGMVAVTPAGKAFGVLLHVNNGPNLDVIHGWFVTVDGTGQIVEVPFDPAAL